MKRYAKLSPRLQELVSMVSKPYDHIWDTCCDHGLLGEALLRQLETKENSTSTVHFVDIVPELMTDVEQRLIRCDSERCDSERRDSESCYKEHCDSGRFEEADHSNWEVRCQDVTELDLSEFSDDQTHLVIIAGVGGELAIEIVSKIIERLSKTQRSQIEFLLCPVYHQYKVRTSMHGLGLKLEREVLLKDGKHFYELLHLSFNALQPIASVGDSMWDFSNPQHNEYLIKLIKHYERVALSSPEAKSIERAYRSLAR